MGGPGGRQRLPVGPAHTVRMACRTAAGSEQRSTTRTDESPRRLHAIRQRRHCPLRAPDDTGTLVVPGAAAAVRRHDVAGAVHPAVGRACLPLPRARPLRAPAVAQLMSVGVVVAPSGAAFRTRVVYAGLVAGAVLLGPAPGPALAPFLNRFSGLLLIVTAHTLVAGTGGFSSPLRQLYLLHVRLLRRVLRHPPPGRDRHAGRRLPGAHRARAPRGRRHLHPDRPRHRTGRLADHRRDGPPARPTAAGLRPHGRAHRAGQPRNLLGRRRARARPCRPRRQLLQRAADRPGPLQGRQRRSTATRRATRSSAASASC